MLTSGSFTASNYGVSGVDGSAAIINHPQAAILGIGRVPPWVVGGAVVPPSVTAEPQAGSSDSSPTPSSARVAALAEL